MSESLWRAVQSEVEKQRGATSTGLRSKHDPVPSPVPPEPSQGGPKRIRQSEGPRERPIVRASVPTSGRPKERLTERRPYDFYRDQVFWLKEIKLEIEKVYGRNIPANAIVQLALDLFIEDYERRGERSTLILNLLLSET